MIYKIFSAFFICFTFMSTDLTAAPYYDDFNGSEIDATKWQNCPNGRIIDGRLYLEKYGSNSWTSTGCYIAENNITNYLSALVSLGRNSYTIGASSVAVKIGGVFYNDTYNEVSGYNNWEGNIFADIRLQLYMGQIRARAVVVRFNNSTGSSKTPTSAFFNLPIDFDNNYLLSIKLIGSTIIFTCNDESKTYYIRTPIYPTNKLRREMTAMIYADIGEGGFVSGYFDDVCLSETCTKSLLLPSIYKLLLSPKE